MAFFDRGMNYINPRFSFKRNKKRSKKQWRNFWEEKTLWDKKDDDEHLVMKVTYNDKRLNILRNKYFIQLRNKYRKN